MALAVILIGLIVLLLFIFFFKQKEPAVVNANINKTFTYNPPFSEIKQNLNTASLAVLAVPPSADEVAVRVLSLNFSERFGSYSNQSDLANFSDLINITTATMQNYLDNLQKTIKAEDDSLYHGLTTKVLKVEVKNLNGDNAETLVSTQRQETNASQNIFNRISYQNLKLKLVKNNSQWLVDGAWWQ